VILAVIYRVVVGVVFEHIVQPFVFTPSHRIAMGITVFQLSMKLAVLKLIMQPLVAITVTWPVETPIPISCGRGTRRETDERSTDQRECLAKHVFFPPTCDVLLPLSFPLGLVGILMHPLCH
jgi:hypothetical protein